MRNYGLNWLSKLGYKYFNNSHVGKFDVLPCSERFDNALAAALKMSDSFQDLSKVIICGMAGPIDSWYSATSTSAKLSSEKLIALPSSESFDSAFALALRTFKSLSLRRGMIWGMAGLINSRNSATGMSVTFRSENSIPYLALRVSPMHLHP